MFYMMLRENCQTTEMDVSSQQLSGRVLKNWRAEVGLRPEQ